MSLGKYLTFEVPHDDQTAVLSGTADFTVWYDNDKLVRTQFVVVDRKGHGSGGPAGMTTTFMGGLFVCLLEVVLLLGTKLSNILQT